MNDLPVLTILIALPLVGALVTAFLPAATARLTGLGFAGATLVWAVVAALTLFAPASVCLGFVTPFTVRLKLRSID